MKKARLVLTESLIRRLVNGAPVVVRLKPGTLDLEVKLDVKVGILAQVLDLMHRK